MSGLDGFRQKKPAELRAQLRQAVAQLSGERLAPTDDTKQLLALSEPQIKEKYPRRYEMYQSLVRGTVGDSNAWFGNSEAGKPLGSLDISRMKKWLHALNNLDTYIAEHESGEAQTLRGRQATVFEDMRGFIERGGGSGYVKLPTGTGKTVLFSEFVEALDLRTLIVVPTKLLVDQTEERLKQFAPELDVGVVRSGRKKDLSKQCTVITYESLMRKLASEEIHPTDYDCLILDEAHVGLSDARKQAIGQFNNALRIGFTATPDFSPTKGVKELLGTEIHRMSIKEAVLEEGLLSGFQCILAKTETDLSKVRVIGGEKYDEKELEQAVNNLARNQAAVDLYKQMFAGEMGIAYCAGIQHATDLAEMFNKAGVSAEVISGKTSETDRIEILRRYDAGEIKVLCNSDLLIAGFDQPKATVCLNLRPTLSPVVAEQRGGRVLRVNEADEEKVAYIVDFVDKGHNPKHYPTLFAEVAEETALLRRGRLGRRRYKKLDVEVKGLEVESEQDKVAEFIKQRHAQIAQSNETLEERYHRERREVLEAGIQSTTDYRPYSVLHKKNWMGVQALVTHPLFPRNSDGSSNWDEYFGRNAESDKDRFLREQTEVRSLRLTSTAQYNQRRSENGWFSIAHLIKFDFFPKKKGGRPDWVVYFGRETNEERFKREQDEVRKAGILLISKYKESASKNGWMSLPKLITNSLFPKLSNGTPDWDTYFGRKKKG